MTRSKWERVAADREAQELQRLIRARGRYEHVEVQARSGHLLVKVVAPNGASHLVARAGRLAVKEYGLSFRTHAGRWEPTPVCGPLAAIAEGLTGLLGAYLDGSSL